MKPQSADELLTTPRRQRLLEHIWQRTSLSRSQFAALYRSPLERYAELVQQLPASESHHHAYPGGMLDHGLEIVAYALKLRQSYLLPVGAPPESQAAQAEAWTAGAAYAALLHDVGKIAVDLHVEHADGSTWHPWHGPLRRPYRFRYRPNREYRLHGAATALLYSRVIHGDILDWLSGYTELWSSLLYALAGQYEHAGVLGDIVVRADRASAAHELGGDATKVTAAPKHALSRKLLDGLRYLVREEFRLNQPGPSDGWLTHDALWLVSKTATDRLRAHLLSQGAEGIPERNTALFDVLQDHGLAQPTPEGRAIWRAVVTTGNGWSQSFTFIRLAPTLIWDADNLPPPFAGSVCVEQSDAKQPDEARTPLSKPSFMGPNPPAPPRDLREPIRTRDELTESMTLISVDSPVSTRITFTAPRTDERAIRSESMNTPPMTASFVASDGVTTDAGEPSGAHFIDWLRRGIAARRIIVNDAKALVHTVADTAYLVSPGLFQRYAQEHPLIASLAKKDQVADWRWVQKRFEHLRIHIKHKNGLNIWTCEVSGPRKSRRLHGYLLADPGEAFSETPANNPYLKLIEDESALPNLRGAGRADFRETTR